MININPSDKYYSIQEVGANDTPYKIFGNKMFRYLIYNKWLITIHMDEEPWNFSSPVKIVYDERYRSENENIKKIFELYPDIKNELDNIKNKINIDIICNDVILNLAIEFKNIFEKNNYNVIINCTDNLSEYKLKDDGFTFMITPQHYYNRKNMTYLENVTRNGKCIFYFMEQVSARINDTKYSEQYMDLTKVLIESSIISFDYNKDNLQYFDNIHYSPPPIITNNVKSGKIYDILFIGIVNDDTRRKDILDSLKRFFKIKIVYDKTGQELTKIINQSKVVLNLHYYNENTLLEEVRLNEIINSDTHILSELPHIDVDNMKDKYKNRVNFINIINKPNKIIKKTDPIVVELKKLLNKPNKKYDHNFNNDLTEKILIENIGGIIEEYNKYNEYPHLFHKYLLKIKNPNTEIIYNVEKEKKYKNFYVKNFAHLHCYDISKFHEIYDEYLDKIDKYFNIIITYSIGEIKDIDYTIIKIPNKGMDIGAKFCMIKYLNDKNLEYDYVMFLHSKSDPKQRKKYFQIVDDLNDKFIKNIHDYDSYFPDIKWEIIDGKLKMLSGNPEYENSNLPERNLLYRNELLKYLNCDNNTNIFTEGNVYILKNTVINKLFTDKYLYNILNEPNDFDYNWITYRYGIKGDIKQVYDEFKLKKMKPRDEKSYDGYIEHAFERMVMNLCEIKENEVNLIGLKNINVSIKDNLFLFKNYLNKLNNNTKINIYDISEINKINHRIKTIFCIQPYEITNIISKLSYFNKPEVLWVWEFKSLPQIFKDYEKYFSKVYTPSQFCYDVFSKHLSIPIQKVELNSMIFEYIDEISSHKIVNKKINNILENTKKKIIYGFCFDLNSSILRKNPLNLVKAFNNLNDETKVLILKYRPPRSNKFINNIENDIYNSFITEVKKNKNIYCITDELEPLDLYKLYTNFDYYISPHCGEGFGITIYDNMILGNKIISPYYSGETEYLNREEIIELEYDEKEIPGLREHSVYGQMNDFKGSYISVESIVMGLNNIIRDEIYILGNGPSLKNCDFNFLKYKTTFALNSAYKKFEELDFYPTYFGCFDPKLIECHYDKFVQLMNKYNKIKRFFFLNENNKGQKQFLSQDENNSRYQKINFLPPQESYINKSSFNKFYKMNNSGATAALISILLGYKKIILLGCDCNYVEKIPGSKIIDVSTKTLQILKTPEKNPNYWFDNYQEKGEIYSLPDGNGCHMKGWELLYQASKIHNIEIINNNTESKIPYFEKSKYEISYFKKRKLIYKIISKSQEKIIINNEITINLKKDDIFTIYYYNNYTLFLNSENIGNQDILEKIEYTNKNYYDLSIVLPFSLDKLFYESKINFNYVLKEYIKIIKDCQNIQLCLTHTEKEYNNFIDQIIINNNINYIFVKNPYNFNLGYNRNIWKYVCNSNKIMFNDIDIPLKQGHLIELIKNSKNFDIVKPYDKNLIHTDRKEKDLYIKNNTIPNKKPKCLFSVTGGITLFDKKVLLETGGYEELNNHGYEDRLLDVIVLNNGYSIKRLDNNIVHLYHPEISFYAGDFDSINKKFYNCCINKDCIDNIHEKCNHIKDTIAISYFNRKYNGNLNLFINPYLNSINLKNIEFIKYNKELYDNYPLEHFFKKRENVNKLKYKLKIFEGLEIIITTCDKKYNLKLNKNELLINNNKHIINDDSKKLIIYKIHKNKNELFINKQFIIEINKIINIEISENNHYSCSINIPISLSRTNIETLINFDYIIKKYLQWDYQINILHTDYNIDLLDNFALNNDKINYIYVKNPYFFNLGYTRNLYKYLNLSENIMFIDVDIPLEQNQINIMIEQLKEFDIVKPYDKQLIHLSRKEKYNYIKNPEKTLKNPKCLFSITGGITMFKKNVIDDCGGYEELNCYGREDRFLDVIVLHKGYKIKKNEFNLIHLWHPKSFMDSRENNNWISQSNKADIFNKKYYNCTLDLKGDTLENFTKNNNDLHANCNHNTKYIDLLIDNKKKYNSNINLFNNNKYLDSIIMKKEIELNDKIEVNDKILFIMGNGPSLSEIMNNEEYLNILRNNHTFGLNSAYRAYEKYNFYPTYFGCFDYVVNESHKESFENLVLQENGIKEFYFIGNTEKKQNLFKEEVRNNERFKKFNFKHIDVYKYPGISESFEKYYNPGSSGANALQIGIMKGYKKIVLLGCDCNYIEEVEGVVHYDPKAKNRLELTKDLDNNPNYWFAEYQKKGDRFNLPGTSKFQMGSWKNMSDFCPRDVEIINASVISKIPYFPKNNFDKITFIYNCQ